MNTSIVVALYRKLIDKRSRRTHSTAIVKAGGRRTVFDCVCGATHTEAANWGCWVDDGEGATKSVHARKWREAHSFCMEEIVSRKLGARVSLAALAPSVAA